MTTNRAVTLPGGGSYNANFNAQSYSGRLESGYHIALAPLTLTPYAALQVQAFEAPAYGESAATGASAFALNYGS
jgi:outer membrane autotransporter protein